MSRPDLSPSRFELFRSGSRVEFKHYYQQYCRRIYYYLQDRTGDPNAAADLTQKVFVVLFKDRAKVTDESHILPFLYTTAGNLCFDHLRETGQLKETKADLAYLADEHTEFMDVQSAEKIKGDVLMALRQSWLTLPARKRRIIVLFYWRKKSTAEIAQLLDVEVQTVRNHLAQSIILLRKNFRGHWEEINFFFS